MATCRLPVRARREVAADAPHEPPEESGTPAATGEPEQLETRQALADDASVSSAVPRGGEAGEPDSNQAPEPTARGPWRAEIPPALPSHIGSMPQRR